MVYDISMEEEDAGAFFDLPKINKPNANRKKMPIKI